jgi:hypothetical protein
MSINIGPFIPLSGLVFMADPRNTKCYPGTGTAAYNQIDNQALTLSSSSAWSGNYFTPGAAYTISSNNSYSLTLSSGYTVIQFMNLTTKAGGTFGYTSGSNTANLYMGNGNVMQWGSYLTGGTLSSNTTVPTGVWHSWAGSFSGTGSPGGTGTSKIYYNGVLDNQGSLAGSASIAGNFQLFYSGPPNGQLGPTLFYSRVLSDTEVRTVFQAYRTSFGI